MLFFKTKMMSLWVFVSYRLKVEIAVPRSSDSISTRKAENASLSFTEAVMATRIISWPERSVERSVNVSGERERERERDIYTCRKRQRQREREKEAQRERESNRKSEGESICVTNFQWVKTKHGVTIKRALAFPQLLKNHQWTAVQCYVQCQHVLTQFLPTRPRESAAASVHQVKHAHHFIA